MDKIYNDFEVTFSDTLLAKFYGLPKIHKENIPLRPIISTTNTLTCIISQILYEAISYSIKPPISHIKIHQVFKKYKHP